MSVSLCLIDNIISQTKISFFFFKSGIVLYFKMTTSESEVRFAINSVVKLVQLLIYRTCYLYYYIERNLFKFSKKEILHNFYLRNKEHRTLFCV